MPPLISAYAIFIVSMLFCNIIYSILWTTTENSIEDYSGVIPWRWLAAVVIPFLLTFWCFRKKSLDAGGAITGFFMNFILILSSYAHFIALATFLITGTKVTKFRSAQKKKIEANFKESGQRNWIHALCNGGVATQLALLYLLDVGSGERPIDFHKQPRSSWLSIGFLGAVASCVGDTWGSEIGKVIGTNDFLITTGKTVPKGTNGGVSWIGLLSSIVGGLLVGISYYIVILITVDTAILQLAAPQWPIIVAAGFAGLFGRILNFLLGATVQYTGIDENGAIAKQPGKGIKHISGKHILDNQSVTLLSSIGVVLILPRIAKIFWP